MEKEFEGEKRSLSDEKAAEKEAKEFEKAKHRRV